jgi:hypothetical protein
MDLGLSNAPAPFLGLLRVRKGAAYFCLNPLGSPVSIQPRGFEFVDAWGHAGALTPSPSLILQAFHFPM